MKQYQGTNNRDRDPQGVTSAQPPAQPSQKQATTRQGESPKKMKDTKPREHRETK